MKKLIVLLMLAATAYGQTPTYTPMRSFYEYKGIKMDSLFLLPTFSDTNAANLARTKSIDKSVIMAGTVPYVRDLSQSKWVSIGEANTNFANTDLTATGDRYHNFVQYNMLIDNTKRIAIIGNDFVKGVSNYIGSYSYDYDLKVRSSEITPNGEFAELSLDDYNSYNLECSTATYGASKISGLGKDITVSTDSLGTVKFKNGVTNEYTFPQTSPAANTVMGYTSANTLGWVDLNPAFDAAVDLTSTDYTATKWGVFTVTVNAGAYSFLIPDPNENKGKYITVINTTGTDVTLGGTAVFPSGNISTAITTIGALDMMVAYSDGTSWYGFIQ